MFLLDGLRKMKFNAIQSNPFIAQGWRHRDKLQLETEEFQIPLTISDLVDLGPVSNLWAKVTLHLNDRPSFTVHTIAITIK